VDIQCEAASKDLQKVNVHSVSNLHLKYEKVNELYTKVGEDFVAKVIEPAVNESVKAATAQFPVESIIVKREDLRQMIEKSLKERLDPYNIVLESMNLVNITFDAEFNKVVEEKQIEEQKIKTTEYQRQQAENMKKTTILGAEAEAEKQKLLKVSVNRDIIELKRIEKWNGEYPSTLIMTGNGVSGMNMMMQLPSAKEKETEK
jgi:regulator of protease activity HflC (stomatin/prohibitin superfamily)